MEHNKWRKFTRIIAFFELIVCTILLLMFFYFVIRGLYDIIYAENAKKEFNNWLEQKWINLALVSGLLVLGAIMFIIKIWSTFCLLTATEFNTIPEEATKKTQIWQINTILSLLGCLLLSFLLFFIGSLFGLMLLLNIYHGVVLYVVGKYIDELGCIMTMKDHLTRLWVKSIAFAELFQFFITSYGTLIALIVLVQIVNGDIKLRPSELPVYKVLLGLGCVFNVLGIWVSSGLLRATTIGMDDYDGLIKITIWKAFTIVICILLMIIAPIAYLVTMSWNMFGFFAVVILCQRYKLHVVSKFGENLVEEDALELGDEIIPELVKTKIKL